ncbi:MAG: hypothetical protein HY290_17635 [Planctomycetia bacterium]|nr:hypothetical protein [Planctomycetia bacterium]
MKVHQGMPSAEMTVASIMAWELKKQVDSGLITKDMADRVILRGLEAVDKGYRPSGQPRDTHKEVVCIMNEALEAEKKVERDRIAARNKGVKANLPAPGSTFPAGGATANPPRGGGGGGPVAAPGGDAEEMFHTLDQALRAGRRVLQQGGHTINAKVLRELKLTRSQAKQAMERAKEDAGWGSADHNNTIIDNGDIFDMNGNWIGNLQQ